MTVREPPGLEFRRYGARAARELRAEVESIYTGSYVRAIESGDPFDSVASFMRRFDSYTRSAGYDLVVVYVDDQAVGQSWGWPLDERASTGWWSGLLSEPEPGFTREDGKRTFALSEIMVRVEWAGRGVARRLHDELLSARDEQRATLLVEPENTRARQAYLHWGWTRVAQLRPRWDDAPLFDVLVLPLPAGSSRAARTLDRA